MIRFSLEAVYYGNTVAALMEPLRIMLQCITQREAC